ncbi:MAG TPA: sulfotransferase domain-containing protein [Pyrinomonadaceae bacterium]|nr:sulfotransferase domain-containing protein [Pyrinomonadaceae bacterium]
MAITFFRSARSKVKPDFPFYDHLSHNLLLAHKARIDQLLAHQRADEALLLLGDALKVDIVGTMTGDNSFRRSFADVVQNLGLVFFEHLQFNACVACCRRAISIEPCPTYTVNLTNALSLLKEKPLLSDFSSSVTPQDLGRHIFIACVPKSASTFLKNVLVGITGYRDLFAVFAAGQNEHDLYLPVLNEFASQNTVTQQHARASEANIQLMQAFGIRPVVLVRNIFDAVVSLHDFYKTGAYFNSYFRGSFLDLDDQTQVDLLIDNVVPWYLQFVASWSLVEKEGRLETLWLDYDELIQNKEDSVGSILKFYGLGSARSAIQKSIETTEADARRNRFNKGVAGRGVKKLTNSQKERIISLTKYYPHTDFGLIGL